MEIVEYPKELHPQKKGVWEEFVRKHYKKYGRLISLFEALCERLRKDDAVFGYYAESEHVKHLGQGLWEFRIPPTGKGGVLRVYFGFAKSSRGKIVILDAEVKKRAKGSTEEARKRLQVYHEWERSECDGAGAEDTGGFR